MEFLDILRAKLAELLEQRTAKVAEAEAITAAPAAESRSELTDDEDAAFEAVRSEIDKLDSEIDTLNERIANVEAVAARRQASADAGVVNAPEVRRDPGDVWDVRNISVLAGRDELRGRAVTAVEHTDGLDDTHRARAIELLERNDTARGALARRILGTGHPAYRSACQKLMGGAGHLLDNDERQALQRAASLTDANGGYAIPFPIDPTIILTNDGAANPFRQLCRVESIVTDSWQGISSGGVTGGYAAEASEVGDDAPTLAQPQVPVHRWDVFVPFSFEIGLDWLTMERDIRAMVEEKRDEFDTVAFTTGSGSNAPTGITKALDGTTSEKAPATAETFAIGDLYALEEALPPKYRRTASQAAWMMALGTINVVRQFDTEGGSKLIARLGAGTPPELLGYALHENSAMKSATAINAGATADNFIAVLGDWRNYLIADRVGMQFELVPHLFDTTNNRPSGQRGFLAWGRTGADSVNDNAFRMLSIPTAA